MQCPAEYWDLSDEEEDADEASIIAEYEELDVENVARASQVSRARKPSQKQWWARRRKASLALQGERGSENSHEDMEVFLKRRGTTGSLRWRSRRVFRSTPLNCRSN